MRILQIGSVLLLSYSIAACSQQNVQPGTAYASAGSTHPQTELFGDEKQQPAARPSSQASPIPATAILVSNIPANHSGGQSNCPNPAYPPGFGRW
ncbi:MAG: hypothetical protein R3E93_15635 [Thiothrix sp.]